MLRRLFVLLVLVIIIGFATGVIMFTRNNNQFNIVIDGDKAEQRAEEAIEKAKGALRKTGQAVENAGEKVQENNEPAKPANGGGVK